MIDDFVCQASTEWMGLGALDVLTDVLDLPPKRRADLLSWSRRHAGVYRVLAGDAEQLSLLNLINDRRYRVRMDLESNPFQNVSFVSGSLVPWKGRWYWSGVQRPLPDLDETEIAELKSNFRMQPNLYYRLCDDDLKKAREIIREQYEIFTTRHGKDWVVLPDGAAMVADWKKDAAEKFARLSPREQRDFLKRHGLTRYDPAINAPPEILEETRGIGVYFNPDEGQEIFPGFQPILSGLDKKGVDLTDEELAAIREWIWSESISPGFVRRLADEHGDASIKAAFLLDKQPEPYALEYLLRRYKGSFYRPRYPTLTLAK